MIYPPEALVREVVTDEQLQEVSTVVDVLGEKHFVEGKGHFEETYHRLHNCVELVTKLKQGRKEGVNMLIWSVCVAEFSSLIFS